MMYCPKCNGKTAVIDSRADGVSVCRKRKCKQCGNIFFTSEREDEELYFREMEKSLRFFMSEKRRKEVSENV